MFNVEAIRQDFPLLTRQVHERPLIYLDNAATTQKPRQVIDTVQAYYQTYNANVHRGIHALSEAATNAMEAARTRVQQFIHARHAHEIIFTKGTTDSLNLLAYTLSASHIRAGDEVLITHMEHHSNIVPWQLVCERVGAHLKVVPIQDDGTLNLEALEQLLTPKTRLLSLTHVSNTLGTINPIQSIIAMAHVRNIPVIVDGAQAVAHMAVDVQALDCDFYVFSGHKLFGPTGTGILYGKEAWLDRLPPFEGGGDMIRTVSFDKTTYAELPFKFEAGTPNIAGNIGLGAAIDYLAQFSFDDITRHEQALISKAHALAEDQGIRIIGQAPDKAAVLSIYCEDVHPHDLSTLLDYEGIAIRAGHHCTMPLMQRFDVPATVRASFALYNTLEEVDLFFAALENARRAFA